MIRAFDPFEDICPFCLDELRRGIPENGICDHEEILAEFPHLRFNAASRLNEQELRDSAARFAAKYVGTP